MDSRATRLSRSLSGTNLERAGDYNLRTVLQAVRLNGDTTRAEIAQQTGLSAPTIEYHHAADCYGTCSQSRAMRPCPI
jgi:hypothetical protein